MIPRIVHQAWCGPVPIPAREATWCALMKKMNPDFDVRFYGNELLERYGQDAYVKEMLSRGTAMAFVCDRLRCLLLRDEGGIWLDPDCQPVKPLSKLNHVWDAPHLTFVHAYRSARRSNVALHRGVTFADDTFLASAKDSRTINRVLEAWTPSSVVINGHDIGIQVMEYAEIDTLALNHKYFYSLVPCPEALVMHDAHNLGSWVATKKHENDFHMRTTPKQAA